MTITLHPWQEDALNALKGTLRGGIIEAATGAGKTVLGLKILEQTPDRRILIVTPTIVLQGQWKREILKFGVGHEDEISLIGGGHKEAPTGRITIAVVDSLRKVNWKHPCAKFHTVICDEAHRYASPSNIKFLSEGDFDYIVGLTATLERSDGKEALLHKYIGPTVYTLTQRDAIDLDYIADYDIELVQCPMTQSEALRYTSIEAEVKRGMQIFNNNFPQAQMIVRTSRRHPLYQYAISLMRAVQERKAFLTSVHSKHDAAVNVIDQFPGMKIILFDEIQDSANKLYEKLMLSGHSCALYHSSMKKRERETSIERFRTGAVNILVTVKALDEGLDVKEAEIAIIVNGNSQKRQVLQRLGRVLRKQQGKVAKLFMLFVPGTQDQKYVEKRMLYLGKKESNEFDEIIMGSDE